LKTIALKASKKKVEALSEDDSEEEEKAMAMLAKNFRRLMSDDRFKKKFSEKVKKAPREAEPEEEEKKDPRGPKCFECSGFGHIQADCGNLKKGKGKAYNVTLSDESKEEASESEKFLAFVAPHVEEEDSYYSEHSDNGEELKEAYKTLYIEYEKLREGRKQDLHDLNNLQTEKSTLLHRIQELEQKKKPRPRKKFPDRLIMALDLQPSSRLHGIRLPIIKHQDIKLLGLMHHDTRHLSISGLSSDLY
jgi:hypothetical protein